MDLRHGLSSIVERFEAEEPHVEVGAVSLSRNDDCELEWSVAGPLVDADGEPGEVVEGLINDATGDYAETRRYEPPGP